MFIILYNQKATMVFRNLLFRYLRCYKLIQRNVIRRKLLFKIVISSSKGPSIFDVIVNGILIILYRSMQAYTSYSGKSQNMQGFT